MNLSQSGMLGQQARGLTITSPLDGAQFSRAPELPMSRQTVPIKFWTQIQYDRVEYSVDGILLTGAQLPIGSIKSGAHRVRVELYLEGKSVGREEVVVGVE